MEAKKKIKIIVANDTNPGDYIKFLSNKYDVEIITHLQWANRIDHIKIDLVLFTGGEDVNPDYYAEPIGNRTHVNKNRDAKEQQIFNRFRDIPKLGICRGAQFLTVMNGGELVQHVNNHTQSHEITVNGIGDMEITSTHHQMMYPFVLPKDKYQLLAWSKYFRSDVYLNGHNKEKTLPKDFLEPEIVYYKASNSLCIQGHPEMSHCPKETSNLCLHLIERYLDI